MHASLKIGGLTAGLLSGCSLTRMLIILCAFLVVVFFSDYFVATNGVKQGGVLSPVLFCVYIDNLLLHCLKLRLVALLVFTRT